MKPDPAPEKSPASPHPLDEDSARRVVMVRAHDALPDDAALWSADDRAWATRLARQSCGETAPLERFVAERARHAWQRLSGRESALARWAARPGWHPAWLALAALAGAAAGLAIDAVGSAQRINLLSVPVWGVVAWNLVVVAWVLWQSARAGRDDRAGPGPLRRLLARHLSGGARGGPVAGPAATGAAAWGVVAMPLNASRVAALLHAAAAALVLGMIASLYLRGLVLDYRAGWQSSFLDAATVQAVLSALLAPASALSGIAVPAVESLRTGGGTAPTGAAAPWLHLYAVTLALFALLPRAALAALALWRAARLAKAVPLPWHEAYFHQLARLQSGAPSRIEVWPHGAAPSPTAPDRLRRCWSARWGDTLTLQVEAAVAVGDEDLAPSAPAAAAAAPSLRVAWFDLTATPESETHGRWVRSLQARAPAAPLAIVVDEAAFAARFGSYPGRLAQRRDAWRAWGRSLGIEPEFLPPPA